MGHKYLVYATVSGFMALWYCSLQLLQRHLIVGPSLRQQQQVDAPIVTGSNWKTSARACQTPSLQGLFKSQQSEDRGLLHWFYNLCGGTYVEMGGLDGVKFSNTHVFNKGLGWKGVLVELVPGNYEKMKMNRPNELATVNAAVCDKRQTLHYVNREGAVSGIWEFMAPSFRKKWHNGLSLNDTVPVECKPLNDLFMETVGESFYFDFFSLDIEGGEYEALATLDFSKYGFGILVVESSKHNNRKNLALRMLLESKGYKFLKDEHHSYWFVNDDFGLIYKDLLHDTEAGEESVS